VHYWSGGDGVFTASTLTSRVVPRNDLLTDIRWEPRAPVPKALV
jgi:hypothetical protein